MTLSSTNYTGGAESQPQQEQQQQDETMASTLPISVSTTSMASSFTVESSDDDMDCRDANSVYGDTSGDLESLNSAEEDPNSSDDLQDQSDDDEDVELHHAAEGRHARYVEPHVGYKKVLVTGGAGFIGSSVALSLLERGDDVVIVDEVNDYYDVSIKRANLKKLTDSYGQDRCRIYEGDMCDVPFITNIYETEKPQWVVHLAARAGVRPSIQDPFIYVHSNVEATTRLLELSRIHGCKSFAFASSSSVYGGSMKETFSETDIVDFPVSPYAATKKSCELIAHTYHHLYHLPIAGLRFFTVYGPRGRPDMAPYKFIDRVFRGEEIQQYGDGTTSRDYTYIEDIVDGVIRSLDRPAGYQIYNLGRGTPTSLSRFIGLVETHVGNKADIRVMPEQPGDVQRTCADISKAREMLGYNPTTPFPEGIRKTVEWFRGEFAAKGITSMGSKKAAEAAVLSASTPSLVA